MRAAILAATQLSGAVSYSAEATALFARMSVQPDAARKGHIDTLIAALKNAGIWSKLDALYVLAAHDAQAARLNWISTSYNLSAVNSPTFTTDRGYTGDGATSYLDTAFNPVTAGGKFAQNDAHLGVWSDSSTVNASQFDIGTTRATINVANAANSASMRANAIAGNACAVVGLTGWTCWARSVSTGFNAVRNAETPVAIVRTSDALLSLPFYVCAASAAGPVASNFSTRRIQAAHFGSNLTNTELAAFYSAELAYMQAVGAA